MSFIGSGIRTLGSQIVTLLEEVIEKQSLVTSLEVYCIASPTSMLLSVLDVCISRQNIGS